MMARMVQTTYAVLTTDPSGATRFEDRDVYLEPAVYVPNIPLVDIAEGVPVTSLVVSRCDANYVSDWHPAPRRQFVLILSGGLDVTSSERESRRFDAGNMFLVEDVVGQGHQTKSVGDDPCFFVTVACADQPSI